MDAQSSKAFLCKISDPDQEFIVDIDDEIHEPVLTVGCVNELKQKIEIQSLLILDQVQSFVKCYTIESTFPFPKFIHLLASNFSSAERVVINFDGSTVLCQINVHSIREALHFPKSDEEGSIQFNEKELIRSFRDLSLEQKN